jgi:hypothetical protein
MQSGANYYNCFGNGFFGPISASMALSAVQASCSSMGETYATTPPF